MSAPNRLPLKSIPATPDRPHAAETAGPRAAVGGPTGAARKGARSALRPDPHPGDGRRPVAWLHITAPGRRATPTARSWCACGRDRFAAGHPRVLALISDHHDHRAACPLRNPQEGRAAA
ncbi:hypothetical protein [Streptomyces xinghaiensis]|uniref:hypothetical protein n=1 Tax=Streptomyces xinghaiensis TaxID=1038928 RepID=UPI00343A2B8C